MTSLDQATPLSAEAVLATADSCQLEPLVDMLTEMGEDDLDDYEGTKLLVEGDLVIDGDLDLGEHDVSVLIVRGSLEVKGFFRDTSDDGPSMTVITGDLRANNVITAGLLEVQGNMEVTEAIVGDYNHGEALVRGRVKADLLMPVEITYTIEGAIEVGEHLAGFQLKFDTPPRRLHPRYFKTESDGTATLFAGEASDKFLEAIVRGESILAKAGG